MLQFLVGCKEGVVHAGQAVQAFFQIVQADLHAFHFGIILVCLRFRAAVYFGKDVVHVFLAHPERVLRERNVLFIDSELLGFA